MNYLNLTKETASHITATTIAVNHTKMLARVNKELPSFVNRALKTIWRTATSGKNQCIYSGYNVWFKHWNETVSAMVKDELIRRGFTVEDSSIEIFHGDELVHWTDHHPALTISW